ncbi:MAG TPA: DMT family transporter [Kofleriaceae bacterium]|nr:DMT family transporter [Kofleriaceae bacterium]
MFAQLRLFLLTTVAMIAFAANSLLCRAALRDGALDATSYTAIRLASGALVLAIVVQARRGATKGAAPAVGGAGSWASALALAGYAIAFSYAYLQLSAGTGALLLFGAVQLTMIVGALVRGERPARHQWLGYAIALAGMVTINLPSLNAPPPTGAALMIASGIAWGIYSLRGRGAARPIETTAGNFVRSVPLALVLAAVAVASHGHVSARGALLSIASGGLASGLGYCLWYLVLPALGAARGAIVQLAVPVLAAASAVVVLHEPVRRDVAIGGAIVLGGLAIALWPRRSRPAT